MTTSLFLPAFKLLCTWTQVHPLSTSSFKNEKEKKKKKKKAPVNTGQNSVA